MSPGWKGGAIGRDLEDYAAAPPDDAPFRLSLSGLSLVDGDRRFFEAGLFFLHAAKVRPINALSPPA
jgi:hypothetical protein